MSSPQEPQLLTSMEVAELAGLSHTTVCRWARQGRIAPLRKFDGQTAPYVFGRAVLDDIRRLREAS